MRTDTIYIDGKKCYLHCKCGVKKENIKSAYCRECLKHKNKKFSQKYTAKTNKKNKLLLKNFVERVNKHKGWVTLHDLFVELITLHDIYSPNQKLIDTMKPEVQLTLMWEMVQKEYKERIK